MSHVLFSFSGFRRRDPEAARALAMDRGLAYCFCVFDGFYYIGALAAMHRLGLYARMPLL